MAEKAYTYTHECIRLGLQVNDLCSSVQPTDI